MAPVPRRAPRRAAPARPCRRGGPRGRPATWPPPPRGGGDRVLALELVDERRLFLRRLAGKALDHGLMHHLDVLTHRARRGQRARQADGGFHVEPRPPAPAPPLCDIGRVERVAAARGDEPGGLRNHGPEAHRNVAPRCCRKTAEERVRQAGLDGAPYRGEACLVKSLTISWACDFVGEQCRIERAGRRTSRPCESAPQVLCHRLARRQ